MTLKVVDLKRETPAGVTEMVEDASAHKSEFVAFAYVAIMADGSMRTAYAKGRESIALLGAVSNLQHRLLKSFEGN